MLINVSRFTEVQNALATIVSDWLGSIRHDVEDYGALPENKAKQIHSLQMLKHIWDKYNFNKLADMEWEPFRKRHLFSSIKRIEVRAVNQRTGAASLNYFAYKNIGLRVIAIGGNSLSRGLTLEGLCVSYFYRNTMMYDTLLQMGRWFGYRPNYDDLFKIWMAEDAVDWYGYITDATCELKLELIRMERQHQTPEDFGLKVRQDPNSLIITARNKMRTGTLVTRQISVSKQLIETPRLKNSRQALAENEKLCKGLIQKLDNYDGAIRYANDTPKAVLWKHIPKTAISNLVRLFNSHPWHLNFQSQALSEYIDASDMEFWDVAIPFGSSEFSYPLETANDILFIKPEQRKIAEDIDNKMLRVSGTHVKVGAGCSTRIGLASWEIVRDAAKSNGEPITDSTYLIAERAPILMIHVLEVKPEDPAVPLRNCPAFLYALGLGFPDTGRQTKVANYVVNINELKNWIDIEAIEDEEDDDQIQ